ncbi:MAG: hypothetical protein JWP02_3402 [Acidimicrobiales bacterium]|nr:hypothetical protein [Acidimicrobiales bacterium]
MRRALLVVLLVTAALGAACSHKKGYDFPPPPNVSPDESTTVPDYSSVKLAAISGRTTTTIDNSPGQASLAGTVTAPEGAVPGAIVHVERLVGDAVLAIDVATNPDGTWKLENVKGGRYRLRAWRPPDLALTSPQVFFLNGTEKKTNLNLAVAHFTGTNVTGVIAPNPPRVGQPANLAVQVTAVVVDPAGIVRATPQANLQVDLQGGGSWQTQTGPTASTDSGGTAFFRLTCEASGSQPLSASVNGTGYPLSLPPCVESTDTSIPSSTPTTFAGNTTTTRF